MAILYQVASTGAIRCAKRSSELPLDINISIKNMNYEDYPWSPEEIRPARKIIYNDHEYSIILQANGKYNLVAKKTGVLLFIEGRDAVQLCSYLLQDRAKPKKGR